MFSEWPRRTFLDLGAFPGAVPCARLHARLVTREWGFPAGASDDVELTVSELVSNGITAVTTITQTPVVRLWLLSNSAQVLILVWDASPQRPVRIEGDDDAEGGRGLLLVETVSAKWGSYPVLNGGQGKVTWALIEPEANDR
ncbi:MAG: ATP-binding protein [Streptosporangiaceae bacterium]